MLIDVHAHVGRVGRKRTDTLSAEQLVAKMDAWGIDKACVLPLADCPEGWYLRNTTEDVLAACERFGGRLIPFCLVDPRFGDATAATDFRDLLAEYKERGCVGLGEFIPDLFFDDPLCMNLYRQAGEAGLPVLFDLTATIEAGYGVVDDPGLPRLERALAACPDTAFIGHGPTFWAEVSAGVAPGEPGGKTKGPGRPGGRTRRLSKGAGPAGRRRPAPARGIPEPVGRPVRRQRLQRPDARPRVRPRLPGPLPGQAPLRHRRPPPRPDGGGRPDRRSHAADTRGWGACGGGL